MSTHKCSGSSVPAASFSDVLRDELKEIGSARSMRGVVLPPIAVEENSICAARKSELFGVALSGGGIRSATFNLGVLQGLAEFKLLPQIDYLSTVSGGGYIGAWFISLLRKKGGREQVQQVQEALSPEHSHHPERPDQEPIEFLRQYSNYLTPRLGFYSADVWTMVATWTRNFLLNLLLLISFIGAALIVPRLLGLLFISPAKYSLLVLLGAAACFVVTTVTLSRNLASDLEFSTGRVQILIVIPLFLGTLLLAHCLEFSPHFFIRDGFWSSILPSWLVFWVLFGLIVSASRLYSCFLSEHRDIKHNKLLAALVWLLAVSVPSFLTAIMLWAVALFVRGLGHPGCSWILFTWGAPALVLLLSVGVVVMVGIMGMDIHAQAREWLGRLRAWTLIYSVSWIIVCGASIYGPLLVELLFTNYPKFSGGLTLSWAVTTIAGVLSGKSAAASGRPGRTGNPTIELIARIAPFVFMAGFVLFLSFGLHLVLTNDLFIYLPTHAASPAASFVATSGPQSINIAINNPHPAIAFPKLDQMAHNHFFLLSCAINRVFCFGGDCHFITAPLDLLFVLCAVSVLLSCRLDINVFSLHEFYKNRIVRCYLGAIRCSERKPDLFTGFDDNDDQLLKNFSSRTGGYYGPYPIINTTLNVSTGENLAWQERKSASFIFTPLYAGFNPEKGNEAVRLGEEKVAFERPNGHVGRYAYRRTEGFCYPRGVHLGTAVAVSGAATSPNMGYHTSTAVAFLMTVFDVRLGWYVGNPYRQDTYRRSSPRFNLLALTQELFGLSDARAGFVNLSDGGHFDNMGLYELVRRQCRYILVSDAEQDGDLTFSSFTQTIRNCRTDFGVEINISLDRIQYKEALSAAHCVVGTIEYPGTQSDPGSSDGRSDGAKPVSGFTGYLLYLKSSLTGDESADVTGYRRAHREFPHQSTSDQWFTESQFEAYRKLGEHIVQTALGGIRSAPKDNREFGREAFFRDLHDAWYPPSDRVDKLSSKHAKRFTDLTIDLADREHLSFLDKQIFESWKGEEPDTEAWERNAKLRCGALIEFMETVYSDLNLESKSERDHPHNQGWLRIFEHWVAQPIFEKTWDSTHTMYARRFRQFYNDRVEVAKARQARQMTMCATDGNSRS